MRQHILATALAAAVTALAYGQNLNPTVEVTNAYEGGASAIAKPARQMEVPDSVTRFNLDFDYAVFDKPYQGAYEFTPYYVQLKPTPKPSTTEQFYLRLGAGFTLHPELDVVWSPIQAEKFHVNVYATHRSYFGRYHQFHLDTPVDEVYPVVKSGEKMKGYLADTKAGVDAAYGWDGGTATVDVAYKNRMANDSWHFQKMGGIEANGRIRSMDSDEPHFLYDAAIRYQLLGSNVSHDFLLPYDIVSDFTESAFSLDGTFGPVLSADRSVLVDLNLDLARYRGDYTGYTGLLSVTPKYLFNVDRWRLSLGVKVAALIYSEDYNVWRKEYQRNSGLIYPDVHVDFHLLDDRLILQAAATGGDKFNTLSGFFYSRPFAYESTYFTGHSLERIRLMAGARGNLASRFRYDLQGGYARWSHGLVDRIDFVLLPGDGVPGSVQPGLMEDAYNLFFADLDYGWKSESVTVDGRLSWRHARMPEDASLTPAAITGFIRPAYNWGDRFKGGLDVAWSTARKAAFPYRMNGTVQSFRVPGWVDLGLFAEYRFTHRFGFWAKGGNLLNQVVQQTPLHAAAGAYFTLGIVLNF
jgi:hypothetical protein